MPLARRLLAVAMLALPAAAGCNESPRPNPVPNLTAVNAIREGGAAAGNGGETVAAAVGTGWGTLKGVFQFAGTPPTLAPLSSGGKDAQVCDAHPIPNQALVVDSGNKGIQYIAVFARKVSRVHETAQDASQPAVFDQKDCVFLDRVKTVLVGQQIVLTNSDPIAHNTNITPVGDTGTNPNIPGGQTANYSFGKMQASPVAVSCTIHSWMKAYLLPRNDSYAVVTGPDGSFEIPNLPAGEEIEFQIWHERGAASGNGLSAGDIDGRGRIELTIPENGTLDLGVIQVPPSAFSL